MVSLSNHLLCAASVEFGISSGVSTPRCSATNDEINKNHEFHELPRMIGQGLYLKWTRICALFLRTASPQMRVRTAHK